MSKGCFVTSIILRNCIVEIKRTVTIYFYADEILFILISYRQEKYFELIFTSYLCVLYGGCNSCYRKKGFDRFMDYVQKDEGNETSYP